MSEGKVIVITGASDGIGAELARQCAKAGHRVVVSARRAVELAAVAAACGPEALAVVGDMTVRADVERLRDAALARFGHVDVWVNNVGRGITRSVLELTVEDLDEMVRVNLHSALFGMQSIVPVFQQQGTGHLINISSVLARWPMASFRSAYSAMKSALNTLTANLRTDLATSYPGIHVSIVMPGVVSTGFGANALGGRPVLVGGPNVGMAMAQSPEDAVAPIVALIAEPQPELFTNPAMIPLVQRYVVDPAGFRLA
jgi:short-subunit dehydrogenase